MARRRIGQEQLWLGGRPGRRSSALDELEHLIDWIAIDGALIGVYAAPQGEPGWPPLALFKALLLAVWHDLSDVKLAEALEDRASFRRFCGFAADEPTPERTAFVRFRRELVAHGLDRVLFEAVVRQLDARGVVVKTGTLVDATLIASASLRHDSEARWAGHRRRQPVHGYKAHAATDKAGDIIRAVEVTTANVHDGAMLETVLPEDPGEVYADLGYDSQTNRTAVTAAGGQPRIAQRGGWGPPGALELWNRDIGRVRGRIEKVFGTWKRSYGLRRMRWLGLAKAGLQVRLTAMAYNLRRAATILRPGVA